MAGIGVNKVDYLLSNAFSSMSLGEKVEVKKVGAHHPKDIQITQKEKLINLFASQRNRRAELLFK